MLVEEHEGFVEASREEIEGRQMELRRGEHKLSQYKHEIQEAGSPGRNSESVSQPCSRGSNF